MYAHQLPISERLLLMPDTEATSYISEAPSAKISGENDEKHSNLLVSNRSTAGEVSLSRTLSVSCAELAGMRIKPRSDRI